MVGRARRRRMADEGLDVGRAPARPGEVTQERWQRGAPTGPMQLQAEMGDWWLKIPWDPQPGHQGNKISWHLSPDRRIPASPSCALSGRKAFPLLEVSKTQHRKLLQLPG